MVMRVPASDTADQRRLLAPAHAGDERALPQLVDPHRHALEVRCYRTLGFPHDAEDVGSRAPASGAGCSEGVTAGAAVLSCRCK
jgi:hypothetical protein